jgi:hypothetical protein
LSSAGVDAEIVDVSMMPLTDCVVGLSFSSSLSIDSKPVKVPDRPIFILLLFVVLRISSSSWRIWSNWVPAALGMCIGDNGS